MKNCIFIALFMAVFSGLASANVGLLVEFPNGTVYTTCVSISDGANAYQIFKKASLDSEWSDDGQWGRALCRINGVGSDPAGAGCSDWVYYWAFSLAMDRDNDWTTHSPVGFTAGSCWNRDWTTPSFDGHYCAKDGDVLGFQYTDDFPSGYPEFMSFDEICPKNEGRRDRVILRSSEPYWKKYAEDCNIEYAKYLAPQNLVAMCEEHKADLLLLNNTTISAEELSSKPKIEKEIPYGYSPKIITDLSAPFSISFYLNNTLIGITIKVNGASYTTNNGTISFNIAHGDYLVELNVPGFKEFRKIFRIG